MKKLVTVALLVSLAIVGIVLAGEIEERIKDASVKICSSNCSGSGILITRTIEGKKVNFVWTAAHTLTNSKNAKTIELGPIKVEMIEDFDTVTIKKEILKNNKITGSISLKATVIRYSEKYDVALLKVEDQFFDQTVIFEEKELEVGDDVFHFGNIAGEDGLPSYARGYVSKLDKYIPGVYLPFDQIYMSIVPGSSGGGIYLKNGKCAGIVVRKIDGFTLMVPSRVIKEFALKADVGWAFNYASKVPEKLEDIKFRQIE